MDNKKKMKEMQELLAPMSAEVISQGSLGIPSAEEPFGTFVENALAKARCCLLYTSPSPRDTR